VDGKSNLTEVILASRTGSQQNPALGETGLLPPLAEGSHE
jgi:hypothetical protein